MEARSFRALIVSQAPDGSYRRDVGLFGMDDLPPGDLLIRVLYSSLNYKDALAASGRRGVARAYPITPGIDAAGVVVESGAAGFAPGDTVLACGHDLGTAAPGGFGQYIRVPASWVQGLPRGLTPRESMIIGTAGFTAALSVKTLQEYGLRPERGEVLVTGATGGVGSMAVAILAAEGCAVTAATGKPEHGDFLRALGARTVVTRRQVDDDTDKALLKERWAGVIDTVGGGILAAALKSTMYRGSVAACGNAMSPQLPITVFPFILRGVRLLGIEATRCSASERKDLWERLAGKWRPRNLAEMAQECTLEGLSDRIDQMLQGGIRGRVIVNLQDS